MPKTNTKIAKIFFEMASLLAMAGVDWKPQAYRKAASYIQGLDKDIKKLYKDGGVKALTEIEGVGEGIAKKIEQYINEGKIDEYEKLKGAEKAELGEITKVPYVGPKTAQKLYQKLGVKTVKDLERAAKKHKIRELAGFKAKSEEDILEGIKIYRARGPRQPYKKAKKMADELAKDLKNSGAAQRIAVAGSIRRQKKTIGDIDLLATSERPAKLMDAFTSLPEVKRVLAKGKTKAMVVLENNMQADLRVVKPGSWGAALLYFTGSKQFNIRLRKEAMKKGYKLSEYGLFDRETGKKLAGKTEKEIFKKLGHKKVPAPDSKERA